MKMNINRIAFVFVLMTVVIYQIWDKMPSDIWYISIILTIAIYSVVLHIIERRYRIVRSNVFTK